MLAPVLPGPSTAPIRTYSLSCSSNPVRLVRAPVRSQQPEKEQDVDRPRHLTSRLSEAALVREGFGRKDGKETRHMCSTDSLQRYGGERTVFSTNHGNVWTLIQGKKNDL